MNRNDYERAKDAEINRPRFVPAAAAIVELLALEQLHADEWPEAGEGPDLRCDYQDDWTQPYSGRS